MLINARQVKNVVNNMLFKGVTAAINAWKQRAQLWNDGQGLGQWTGGQWYSRKEPREENEKILYGPPVVQGSGVARGYSHIRWAFAIELTSPHSPWIMVVQGVSPRRGWCVSPLHDLLRTRRRRTGLEVRCTMPKLPSNQQELDCLMLIRAALSLPLP